MDSISVTRARQPQIKLTLTFFPQHEVVSLAEKVVLRAEDVIGWMRAAVSVKWDTGLLGVYGPPSQDPTNDAHYTAPISGALDIEEVIREKKLIGRSF